MSKKLEKSLESNSFVYVFDGVEGNKQKGF